jgi:retron-type reverse transcriptase
VPTIADRVAQGVAANRIGVVTEGFFHRHSYGYRPGRGAHDALAVARERCWTYDWVVEFDTPASRLPAEVTAPNESFQHRPRRR